MDIERSTIRGDRAVVGSALCLPFSNSCIDEIHCIHMLEHIHPAHHIPVLTEMRRVLKPGCSAWIEVPDFIKICGELYKLSTFESNDKINEKMRCLTLSVYGKGRHAYDWHHWGFTFDNLQSKASRAGLEASREYDMISSHYKQEPVILVRMIKKRSNHD